MTKFVTGFLVFGSFVIIFLFVSTSVELQSKGDLSNKLTEEQQSMIECAFIRQKYNLENKLNECEIDIEYCQCVQIEECSSSEFMDRNESQEKLVKWIEHKTKTCLESKGYC